MRPPYPLILALLCLGPSHSVLATQTCHDSVIALTPDDHFTVHGDGTVTHMRTGLMWKQCAEGLSGDDCATGAAAVYNWKDALAQAEGLTFAGHSDWRLPNVKELRSLVEERCHSPAINATVFPGTPTASEGYFRASSQYANSGSHAWLVGFDGGRVNYGSRGQSTSRYVRLVRSPQ